MDGDVVQGSREIMDYLDARFPDHSLAPEGAEGSRRAAELEADADARIGVPLRAAIYHRLIHFQAPMKHCFTQGMPAHKKLLFTLTYPVLKKGIYDSYVRDDDYIAQAKATLDAEIARFDKIVQGRTFPVGARLSRADIMVAAMFSLAVLPQEHPCDWLEMVEDEELDDLFNLYQESPSFAWTRRIYRDFRNSQPIAQAAE